MQSKCKRKGPKGRTCLMGSRNSKRASVPGEQGARERVGDRELIRNRKCITGHKKDLIFH